MAKIKSTTTAAIGLLASMFILLSPGVAAQDNSAAASRTDVFRPHVSARSVYDSNVFRLSDDEDAATVIGNSKRSDTANSLEAGLDMDLPISRQRLLLGASAERLWYDRFDFLNHTSKRANGTLQWEIGNQWDGDLGFTYRESIASFNELQTRIRDPITRRTNFINAGYTFHPRWRVYGGYETYDLRRSVLSFRNREEDTKKFGVRYTSRANNYIDLEARTTDVGLPISTSVPALTGPLADDLGALTITGLDNSFGQSELNAEVDYRRSASHVNARVGYITIDHNELSERDYDGFNGRLVYDWDVTAKTQLSFSLFRVVRSNQDLLASYKLVRGISFNPRWSPTAKLILQGRFAYEEQDFRGDSTLIASGRAAREDTVRTASLSLGYTPIDNAQLSLAYETEERDSTRTLADYDYRAITASVRVDF